MKKFKNYLLLCLLTLSLGFAFTACGDDDDDPSYDAAALVGTWKLTAYQGWEKENGKIKWEGSSLSDSDTEKLEFKNDGTGKTYISGGSQAAFKYSVQGNQLVITDLYDEVAKATILVLNDNTLVVESYEKYLDDDDDTVYEYYEKMTFSRVK